MIKDMVGESFDFNNDYYGIISVKSRHETLQLIDHFDNIDFNDNNHNIQEL